MGMFPSQSPWLVAAGAGMNLGQTYADSLMKLAALKEQQRQFGVEQGYRDQMLSERMTENQRHNRQENEDRALRAQAFQLAQAKANESLNNARVNNKVMRWWAESGAQPEMLGEAFGQLKGTTPQDFADFARVLSMFQKNEIGANHQPQTTPEAATRLLLGMEDEAKQQGTTADKYGNKSSAPPHPIFGAALQAAGAGYPGAQFWTLPKPTMTVVPQGPRRFFGMFSGTPAQTNMTYSGMINTNALRNAIAQTPALEQFLNQQGIDTTGLRPPQVVSGTNSSPDIDALVNKYTR